MPNTKSAAKRVRGSATKAARNRRVKNRLKTLEKRYLVMIKDGNHEEAAKALPAVASAYDKAAKCGVVRKEKASRKHSRLQLRLNAATRPAAAAAAPQA
jgi:small subunit ribosomal protein S20